MPGVSIGSGLSVGRGLSRGAGFAGGYATPTINAQFALTGALPTGMTFTRASSGTRYNSAGVLVTETTDVARFDYVPSTLAARGLLIEEARTNIVAALTSWSLIAITRTAGAVISPEGTLNGVKIATDGTSSAHYVFNSAAISANNPYTMSSFVKTAEYNTPLFWLLNAATADRVQGSFNSTTGAVNSGPTPAGSAAFTSVSSAVQTINNAWFRPTLTGTTTGGAITLQSRLHPQNNAGTYTGTAGDGSYFYLPVTELGSFATSPIAPSSTRAADIAIFTGASFSSWYPATQGTIVVQFDSPASSVSGNRTVWAVDDNSANNAMILRCEGTSLIFRAFVGGVEVVTLTLGTVASGTQYKAAIAYATDNYAGVMTGGTVQSDTSAAVPTVDRCRLGASQAGETLCGHIAAFTAYSTRVSNGSLPGYVS